MKSDAYKMNQAELALLEQLHLLTAFFMVFLMSPLFYLIWDNVGLYWSAGILFVSWSFWIDLFTTESTINLKRFIQSLQLISTSHGFKIGVISLFCAYSCLLYTSPSPRDRG